MFHAGCVHCRCCPTASYIYIPLGHVGVLLYIVLITPVLYTGECTARMLQWCIVIYLLLVELFFIMRYYVFWTASPPEMFDISIPSSEMLKNTPIHRIVGYQGHAAWCLTTFYTFVSLFTSALLWRGIIVRGMSATILWYTGLFISWWQFTLCVHSWVHRKFCLLYSVTFGNVDHHSCWPLETH